MDLTCRMHELFTPDRFPNQPRSDMQRLVTSGGGRLYIFQMSL
jgi:hypothetical protein